MKAMQEEGQELIEEIFNPDSPSPGCSTAEILRLVETARQARQRRRRTAACTCAALIVGAGLYFFTDRSAAPSKLNTPEIAATAVRPSKALASAPGSAGEVEAPKIEHVDDEAMLAMIKDHPTALVRWPDGRQTLLLLTR